MKETPEAAPGPERSTASVAADAILEVRPMDSVEFDFSPGAVADGIAPEGRHAAQIADVRFSEGEATWMTVDLLLAESGSQVELLVCVAAPKGTKHASKVPAGAATVKTMCQATGHDVATMKSKEAIQSAFIGADIDVQVVHKVKDGYRVAEVRRLLVPADVLKADAPAAEEPATPVNRTRAG
jgi:hypothetical protein